MSRVYGSATANAALDSAEAGCSVVDKAAIRRSLFILALSDSTFLDNSKAAEYSNIGINKIDSMLRTPNCPFVLFVGTKKLVKRKEFEQFISEKLVI